MSKLKYIKKEDKLNKFIDLANEIHNNKYSYESIEEYTSCEDIVPIKCPIHGIFHQRVRAHLYMKQGCPMCSGNAKRTFEEYVIECEKIHKNNYEYIRFEKNTIVYNCPIHGEVKQNKSKHLNNKNGCPHCCKNKKSNTETFLRKCKEIHRDLYDYSKVEYKNAKEKVIIICKKHGEFLQSPDNHLKGKGCPACSNSSGELTISKILSEEKIKFKREKTFKKCKNKFLLPFDFYLLPYNICIEYDGKQHFEPIEFFGGEKHFKKQKINDQIKNKFCKNNNIKLLRIKYDTKLEDIKNIILEFIDRKQILECI